MLTGNLPIAKRQFLSQGCDKFFTIALDDLMNPLRRGIARLRRSLRVSDRFRGAPAEARLATPGMRGANPHGSILALWPNDEVFKHIYRRPNVHAEIVVPWSIEPVHAWSDIWGARQVVGEEMRPLRQRELSNPDVRQAVESALALSGLTHPSDIDRARNLFAPLRRRNIEIDPRAIRAHALRTTGHGYPAADRLVTIALGRQQR